MCLTFLLQNKSTELFGLFLKVLNKYYANQLIIRIFFHSFLVIDSEIVQKLLVIDSEIVQKIVNNNRVPLRICQ